jgi:hypothetical protein
MEELLALIAAGSLIPAIAFLSKKLIIEKILEHTKKEILITDQNGKKSKYLVEFNMPSEEINKIFEKEIKFEKQVKSSLDKYISQHRKMKLKISEEKTFDFLISFENKRIGVEAKASASNFKANWISDYFSKDSNAEKLIMIFDSKIPESLTEKIMHSEYKNKVKFISSPRGKGLNETIENVLNSELGEPKLNKALQRTSR